MVGGYQVTFFYNGLEAWYSYSMAWTSSSIFARAWRGFGKFSVPPVSSSLIGKRRLRDNSDVDKLKQYLDIHPSFPLADKL